MLTNARMADDVDAELLQAAAQVPRESPAFATVAFHRARVMLAQGDARGAHALLTTAIDTVSAGPVKAVAAANALRRIRRRAATTIDEFLADAAVPALGTILDDERGNQIPDAKPELSPDEAERFAGRRLFDEEGESLVNHLPLADLVIVAERPALGRALRRDVAAAAWVRAFIVDQPELGKRAAAVLRTLRPQLKADLDAYDKAADRNAREIVGVWTLLRYPGLSVNVSSGLGRRLPVREMDHWTENWWCAPDKVRFPAAKPSPEPSEFPLYLTSEARATAKHELEQFVKPGPNYVADVTMRWAKAQPADPRIPQALHLVVEGTRWGCSDAETTRWSRQAYSLLHSKYPKSPWTARTPYWFRGY
jgi:hypothetical protein